MRLKDKVAIVIGAGQSPGEGIGNGRATVLRFVQEGATVMAVDRDLASAEETVADGDASTAAPAWRSRPTSPRKRRCRHGRRGAQRSSAASTCCITTSV